MPQEDGLCGDGPAQVDSDSDVEMHSPTSGAAPDADALVRGTRVKVLKKDGIRGEGVVQEVHDDGNAATVDLGKVFGD